jgi:hypothetical protein
MQELMGEEVHAKFAELKLAQAERCPKALGTHIKASEVQFHHEVTNQYLWSQFSERPVPAPRFPARREDPPPAVPAPSTSSARATAASAARCSFRGSRGR